MAGRQNRNRPIGARQAAARAVQQVTEGRSLGDALPVLLDQVGSSERGLAQELAYGALRWYPRLQWVVEQLLERPLRRRDRDVHALLMVGVYQCLDTRIPEHAAVSETVAAARTLGRRWAGGLVNAVLRRCLRERQALEAGWQDVDTARHAHPRWLLDAYRDAWPDDWEALVTANNQRPPMTLRVNRRQTTRTAYQQALQESGLAATPHPLADDALVLDEPVAVERLPAFDRGHVAVQDAAGQQAAALLDPQPGDRVLDLCAAPGGKTCHLLERQPDVAELVAVELEAARLTRIRENLERLGLAATVVEGDGTDPGTWWDGTPFQRILLDAPCSASGVVRRHPDIKLLRQAEDLPRLQALQQRLLAAAWPLLAPGGMLVYATCSVFPTENEAVVQPFVESSGDAVARPIDAPWGRATAHGRQILSGESGMDGFYYACLVKQ
ncbi:16S rRNA (cytosine(967)-C(5))-methyltransferase RsmB [Aquisalimonas asiatica]|uniref:16S rRNA (cytosine(967)-C(5))-methyltransferase n=1 Tax=Aquisalimonas asiatica TaxID=406100 RepID=A0A1H8TB97_9GAMM|nr:16S rRNA (cytosine(967)-C(5))-methyltransferase RsmB [Aquisalimonas asiatica]SEO88409.1 16S rRNA (cytosine967-C5)-methyltransferase [Aquisalimonas asiatica]